ncbi:MAG: metalloregulator ArsR/SmtB family transcription factor [Bacillota bacterium]
MVQAEPVSIETCDLNCFDEAKVNRLRQQIPDTGRLAELFRVLGDESRTRLLYLLAKEELCVCDLAALLGTSISNVSHHLRILRTARLVKFRRDGRQVFYSIDDDHVLHLIIQGFEHVRHTT